MGNVSCISEQGVQTSQPQPRTNLQKSSIEQLERAVDCLFKKYDKDGNGFLDKKQVTVIINTALSSMNNGKKGASRSQVSALIDKSDLNQDGKISKEELLKLFKRVAKV